MDADLKVGATKRQQAAALQRIPAGSFRKDNQNTHNQQEPGSGDFIRQLTDKAALHETGQLPWDGIMKPRRRNRRRGIW